MYKLDIRMNYNDLQYESGKINLVQKTLTPASAEVSNMNRMMLPSAWPERNPSPEGLKEEEEEVDDDDEEVEEAKMNTRKKIHLDKLATQMHMRVQ